MVLSSVCLTACSTSHVRSASFSYSGTVDEPKAMLFLDRQTGELSESAPQNSSGREFFELALSEKEPYPNFELRSSPKNQVQQEFTLDSEFQVKFPFQKEPKCNVPESVRVELFHSDKLIKAETFKHKPDNFEGCERFGTAQSSPGYVYFWADSCNQRGECGLNEYIHIFKESGEWKIESPEFYLEEPLGLGPNGVPIFAKRPTGCCGHLGSGMGGVFVYNHGKLSQLIHENDLVPQLRYPFFFLNDAKVSPNGKYLALRLTCVTDDGGDTVDWKPSAAELEQFNKETAICSDTAFSKLLDFDSSGLKLERMIDIPDFEFLSWIGNEQIVGIDKDFQIQVFDVPSGKMIPQKVKLAADGILRVY